MRDWLWIKKGLYDGILVPKNQVATLLPYLGHYKMLLAVDDWLCLIFQNPVELDPKMLGHALPLKAAGGGRFSSFDLSDQPVQKPEPDILWIVDKGQQLQFNLATAVSIDPFAFWDFTGIEITHSQPLAGSKTNSASIAAQAPSQSAQMAAISKATPVFEDIHAAVDSMLDADRRKMFDGLGAALLGVRSFFGAPRTIGPADAQPQAGQAKAPPVYQGPGLFERLKGWMLWNTSMGNQLRAQLERNMNEVSKMIERGEIDRALKRAMALGAEQERKNAKSAPMTSLPNPRATLDLDYSGINAPAASILTEIGFEDMSAQYRKLARKLSADGDYKRAAFIYAELLKDVQCALEELEAAKAYEDAAKLATARKCAGNITARLWFLAGQKDIALAMAKRFDSLEYIADISEETDPEYSAFVRGHWLQELIAAGDLTRAVKESAGLPLLGKLHAAVVNQAVQAGLLEEPIVLVAATISLAWKTEALENEPANFGADSVGMIEARLHQIVNGNDLHDAEARQALVAGLSDAKSRKSPVEDGFWTSQVPPLADGLIRAILTNDAFYAGAPQLSELKRFAKEMGLSVMAEDLRHIVRNKPKVPSGKRMFPLPPAKPVAPYWNMLACTANGRTLIGALSGELTLVDKGGARLWTDQVTDLVDVIPIGPGRLVILVQGTSEDRKLTILDTVLHSYRVLGRIVLTAWHSHANSSSWLVQSPNSIGALNVSAMLDTPPAFELLWSIKQTVPIKVLAFQIEPTGVRWVSQRIIQDQPGLLEVWNFSEVGQNLVVNMINPMNDATTNLYQQPHILRPFCHFAEMEQDIRSNGEIIRSNVQFESYSYEGERTILQEYADFWENLQTPASIVTTEQHFAYATYSALSERAKIEMLRREGPGIAVLKGAEIVTQSSAQTGDRLALIDECGRVVFCDFKHQTVTLAKL